jgi:hypothetical protein
LLHIEKIKQVIKNKLWLIANKIQLGLETSKQKYWSISMTEWRADTNTIIIQ